MLPDRVSNPGPLTYESGALPIALRGPAPFMDMCQNYFKNRNSNTKEINKRKNANSQQNLAVFWAATDSENIIIQILHGKKDK